MKNKLEEQDYMMCLLSTIKEIEKNMVVALTECSNEKIFKKLNTLTSEYIKLQREVYESMYKQGYYPLKDSTKTIINEKFQALKEKLNNI